jgi:hypothetical protein
VSRNGFWLQHHPANSTPAGDGKSSAAKTTWYSPKDRGEIELAIKAAHFDG